MNNIYNDCFALNKYKNCTALTEKVCQYKDCKFYKPKSIYEKLDKNRKNIYSK